MATRIPDNLSHLITTGRIEPERAEELVSEIEDAATARDLVEHYGPVSGHMDGQSHPAIDDGTPLYGLLFGRPRFGAPF